MQEKKEANITMSNSARYPTFELKVTIKNNKTVITSINSCTSFISAGMYVAICIICLLLAIKVGGGGLREPVFAFHII